MVQILQKLLHILNKDQKRKVAGLGVMIFIGALMEMIGVGLIMPVVEGVMAPDQLLNKWYIQILERFIHFDTPNQWLLFLIGVIIAVYFIKNGYLLLQTYVQSRFVNTGIYNSDGIYPAGDGADGFGGSVRDAACNKPDDDDFYCCGHGRNDGCNPENFKAYLKPAGADLPAVAESDGKMASAVYLRNQGCKDFK